MKKQLVSVAAFILVAASAAAQQAVKINGQPFGQGDWIGSSNNEAVIFKANNVVGLKIKPDGQLMFKSLDLNSNAGPNGLVITDGQGKIGRLDFSNNSNQILLGNGTWGNLPSEQWSVSGNNIYWNHGNVGIGGSPNSAFKLDVIGDARISNNLFVGGGIVITDKVQATTEIKGWDFKVDNDLLVTGTARLQSAVRMDQGFTFDGVHGIKYIPNSNGAAGGTYQYGPGTLPAPLSSCAAQPYSLVNHSFGGWVQVYDADGNGNYIPGSGLLNFQAWAGGSSIDASIGGNTGAGGLLLNYFCGNNTFINTGANGGKVVMGKTVEIGFPSPADQACALNVNGATNYAAQILTTTHTADYAYNTLINVNRDYTKGLAIFNTASGSPVETFKVFGNGKTVIGSASQTSTHGDALLTVDGKMVARSCYVTLNNWADYVFADDYQLPALKDIEQYYKQNKHLPEIPSEKEVMEQGIDVGEMNKLLLKKIEELTVIMVEQDKKMTEQNKKMEMYQTDLEALKQTLKNK